jgi:hypothetical protein
VHSRFREKNLVWHVWIWWTSEIPSFAHKLSIRLHLHHLHQYEGCPPLLESLDQGFPLLALLGSGRLHPVQNCLLRLSAMNHYPCNWESCQRLHCSAYSGSQKSRTASKMVLLRGCTSHSAKEICLIRRQLQFTTSDRRKSIITSPFPLHGFTPGNPLVL